MASLELLNQRVNSLSQFIGKGFLYNLGYLPDTILGGITLFSLLLQSPPLALLTISLFSLEFVHAGISSLLVSSIPGLNEPSKDVDRCSGHFPGFSYERVVTSLITNGTLKSLGLGFPSYYMMFFGTLFGYMYGLSETYKRELDGMPQRRAAVLTGIVLMGLLTLLFVMYRLLSKCDSFISVAVGSLLGLFYGYLIQMVIASLSGRTLTNILNIPLIIDKAVDGSPIYVCKN
jgi:hypothetical protein